MSGGPSSSCPRLKTAALDSACSRSLSLCPFRSQHPCCLPIWPSRSFTTFAKCHQAATQQLQHITNHLPISFFSRRLLEVNILLKAIPYKTTYTAHCIVPSCRDVLITSYAMFPYVIKKRQRSPPLAEGQHLQIGLDDFFSHARCTGWCPQ